MPKNKHEESHIQSAYITACRLIGKKYHDDPVLSSLQYFPYAIPNGDKRHIAVAKRLKKEGVVGGMPDVHLPIPAQRYHSLYQETKKPNDSNTSADQDAIHALLRKHGNKVQVYRSVKEGLEQLQEYLQYNGLEEMGLMLLKGPVV